MQDAPLEPLTRKLGRYIVEVVHALPPPFLLSAPLLQLLLPDPLRSLLAAPPRPPAGVTTGPSGTVVTATAAAEACRQAAALPAAIHARALAAVWAVGHVLGLAGLCAEAATALRLSTGLRKRHQYDQDKGQARANGPQPDVGSPLVEGIPSAEPGSRREGVEKGEQEATAEEDEIVFRAPKPARAGGSSSSASLAGAAAAPKGRGQGREAGAPQERPVVGAAALAAAAAAAAAMRSVVPRAPVGRSAAAALAASAQLPAWRLRGRASEQQAREVIESIRQKVRFRHASLKPSCWGGSHA